MTSVDAVVEVAPPPATVPEKTKAAKLKKSAAPKKAKSSPSHPPFVEVSNSIIAIVVD